MHRLTPGLALALALSCLLAACSLTRLAYSNAALAYANATPVLAWMVGDYVEMSDVQKGWVRERLAKTLAWHRARELPEYHRFLDWALARAVEGFSVEDARTAHRELRARYHRLLEHVLPDMAEFLLQLDAEQAAQLERRFAEENREIVRESVQVTSQERQARRTRKYLDHIEEWTGRLSDTQRDLVSVRVDAFPELMEEWLGDRRYRQAEALALVRSKPSREQAIARLKLLLVDTETWRRPDLLKRMRERDAQLFEMIAALSATLSPEQRAHLQERLRGFMRDITELTAAT
jgi:Family of unknown function (DUF6279)